VVRIPFHKIHIETRVVVGYPVKDFGTNADEFDPDLIASPQSAGPTPR